MDALPPNRGLSAGGDGPLVSCLLVTQAARAALAPRAIAAFNRQSYPRRELVIVSVDDVAPLGSLVRPPAPVQVHQAPAHLTLGDLRNLAVERAAGEYVATWDDDDWSHPQRLARQLAVLRAAGAQGCVLHRCIFADEAHDDYVIVYAWPHTGYASMLARKADLPPYPALARGEDRGLHSMTIVALDEPRLYVRTLHAANTCDTAHATRLMRRLTSHRLSAAEVIRTKAQMRRR
jgi:glycosyltransferase involved in cell wall biosynthesis